MPNDSRTLVRRTIDGRDAHRIPLGELCIDDGLVAAFTGASRVAFRHRREVAERLGLDLICLAPDYGPRGGKGALPEADAVGLQEIERWSGHTDLFLFVLLEGGFQWGITIYEYQQFLVMAMRRSSEVEDLLRQVEILNQRLIERAAGLGADGVVIADDIAYRQGLLVSPDRIRELFLPSLARQVRASHAAGLAAFYHSDGNLEAVLEDIVGSGFDGLQCIESAAGMDLAAIRAQYGRRLCCWGNLDPACLVEERSAGEIEARVGAVMATGARDGGLIFGTSSGLFEGMRTQNIEQAYQCARRMGSRT